MADMLSRVAHIKGNSTVKTKGKGKGKIDTAKATNLDVLRKLAPLAVGHERRINTIEDRMGTVFIIYDELLKTR